MLKIRFIEEKRDFYRMHFGGIEGFLVGVSNSPSRYNSQYQSFWIAIPGNPHIRNVSQYDFEILWDESNVS